jgi:oxalate decarboxylase/phosphoglucose isomerase-like protein (cupin superfamily)
MDAVKKIDIEDTMWRDERGWGLNPFTASDFIPEGPCDIHVVSMKPGAVRGNHYHTVGTEWMLICGGPARILLRSKKEGQVEAMVADGRTPLLIEIPAHVEHAVRNESTERIYLVVFSDVPAPEAVRCSSLFE